MNNSEPEKVPRLDPGTIDRYFQSPTPVIHLISTHPHCELRIDPRQSRLELRAPGDGTRPNLDRFENIGLDFDDTNPTGAMSLFVETQGNNFASYTFLAQIVENLHNGELLAFAIENSIEQYQALLYKRPVLSREKQTGLIGELLLVRWLLQMHSVSILDCWLGPKAEQHDFAFRTFDLEVKTTVNERRQHRIGSATQLEPTLDRHLWLLSLQITSAGISDDSFSLVQLVDDIRILLGPFHGIAFEAFLEKLGWKDQDRSSYGTAFVLRSNPAYFHVDDSFPCLRDATLLAAAPRYELVSDVSYRIDVTTITPTVPPIELADFYTSGPNPGRSSS